MEEKIERQVKFIQIPIEIWTNRNLTWSEKLVWSEIDSYTGPNQDCYASNKYIADFLGLQEGTVANAIVKLKKLGYIVQTKFDGRRRYLRSNLGKFYE